jgi:hypothetical protein
VSSLFLVLMEYITRSRSGVPLGLLGLMECTFPVAGSKPSPHEGVLDTLATEIYDPQCRSVLIGPFRIQLVPKAFPVFTLHL